MNTLVNIHSLQVGIKFILNFFFFMIHQNFCFFTVSLEQVAGARHKAEQSVFIFLKKDSSHCSESRSRNTDKNYAKLERTGRRLYFLTMRNNAAHFQSINRKSARSGRWSDGHTSEGMWPMRAICRVSGSRRRDRSFRLPSTRLP